MGWRGQAQEMKVEGEQGREKRDGRQAWGITRGEEEINTDGGCRVCGGLLVWKHVERNLIEKKMNGGGGRGETGGNGGQLKQNNTGGAISLKVHWGGRGNSYFLCPPKTVGWDDMLH